MEPLISVIIPIYNKEKILKFSIDSVINQTYKNLEIIVVNDGSTDNSHTLCDEYKNKDNRIKVIHKKNGGLADARNVGIDCASGEYIAFIDGDDCISEKFFNYLYEIIIKYNADIAECDYLRIPVEQIKETENILNDVNNSLEENVIELNNINALNRLYGIDMEVYIKSVIVCNKLYKKSLFNNVKFPIGKLHEDDYTTYKVLYMSNKIVSSNKVLYGYIQTLDSIMRAPIRQQRIDDTLDAYAKCSEFFKEKKLKNVEAKCRRKYLEFCINLSERIEDDSVVDLNRETALEYLKKEYIEKYDKTINFIKENSDKEELEIAIKKLDEYREQCN